MRTPRSHKKYILMYFQLHFVERVGFVQGQAPIGLISCHIGSDISRLGTGFYHSFAVKACSFCLNASVVPHNVVSVLEQVVGMSLVVGSPLNSKK